MAEIDELDRIAEIDGEVKDVNIWTSQENSKGSESVRCWIAMRKQLSHLFKRLLVVYKQWTQITITFSVHLKHLNICTHLYDILYSEDQLSLILYRNKSAVIISLGDMWCKLIVSVENSSKPWNITSLINF